MDVPLSAPSNAEGARGPIQPVSSSCHMSWIVPLASCQRKYVSRLCEGACLLEMTKTPIDPPFGIFGSESPLLEGQNWNDKRVRTGCSY
jgi:hypothetical protein